MTRIVTVTLNPAIDLTTSLDRVLPGKKLRCDAPSMEPGGGGVNVARAVTKLGRHSLAFAVVGRANGNVLRMLVNQELPEAKWFEIDGLTRESFVVNERTSGDQYRFVPAGPRWSESDASAFCEEMRQSLDPGDLVVASGSLPLGLPDDFYVRLVAEVRAAGAHPMVDTSGPALRAIARADNCGAYALLMDEDEACQIIGCDEVSEDQAVALSDDLLNRRVAENVAVTLGARGAILSGGGERWRVSPPKVEVASKVGAGDSFVAGLTIGLFERRGLDWAATYAMAAATSAVTTPGTELCTREGTESFLPLVACTPM